MKRLCFLLLTSFFVISTYAYDFSAKNTNGDTIYYNILGGDSVEVTYMTEEFNSYNGDIVIPFSVDHESISYRVVRIGTKAFRVCYSLKSVIIPNSIKTIGGGAFVDCWSLSSITLPNSITRIEQGAFNGCLKLPTITIPNSVTTIEMHTFYICQSLTSVFLPRSITAINHYAFRQCAKLDTVVCRAIIPPTLGTEVFLDISPNAVLHVPYNSLNAYKAIEGYMNSFDSIAGFSETGEVTENTALLKWIPDEAVNEYTINVYTSGELFRQYLVDGNGNLKNANNVIARIPQMKMDTTYSSDDYFVVSMTSLTSGTSYNYTIDGNDTQGTLIFHEEGSFSTKAGEGIDVIMSDPNKPFKILRNGQILILRREKVYTLQGQEVR